VIKYVLAEQNNRIVAVANGIVLAYEADSNKVDGNLMRDIGGDGVKVSAVTAENPAKGFHSLIRLRGKLASTEIKWLSAAVYTKAYWLTVRPAWLPPTEISWAEWETRSPSYTWHLLPRLLPVRLQARSPIPGQ